MSAETEITKKCPSCDKDISVKAKRCPYCRQDLRNWFRRHPIITLILLLIFVPAFISGLTSGQNKTSTTITVASPSPAIAEETKNALAETFCSERNTKVTQAVNFDDFIKLYESDGQVTLNPAKTKPSQSNCSKVVDICLSEWTLENCQDIAQKKIWIGMTKDQLILSWGVPNDRNNTVGNWGTHEQWVYGDFGPYVYLEGKTNSELVVKSWQNTN